MIDENERMIRSQIVARGVRDPRVLAALRTVPRDLFVPSHLRASAFDDHPLPLERGQTISQPFIVAAMTELLRLRGHEKVLEIGTGSGYQTAILARLARFVCSAELEPALASTAVAHLKRIDIHNVIVCVGNGIEIFGSEAPFDAILAAAAPIEMPERLIEQLADGGRCVIPVGPPEDQFLWLIERHGGHVLRRRLDPVRFVPLRRSASSES